MAISVYLLTVTKRHNSTLQPSTTGQTPVDVVLKTPTSEDAPSFLLSWSGAFSHNYLIWGSGYYWIDNVTWVRNDQVEISCSLDVLATYKSYITGSSQYVAYSAVSGNTATQQIPDKRLAVYSQMVTTGPEQDLTIFDKDREGYYVLSCLGENGCELYMLDKSQLLNLLSSIQTENVANRNTIMAGKTFEASGSDDIEMSGAFQDLADVLLQSDLLGNSFSNAPSCIRSCIWVPFDKSIGGTNSNYNIYLGNYRTTVWAPRINEPIVHDWLSLGVSHYYPQYDWRRVELEEWAMYLPLVGLVSLPSDRMANESALKLTWSASLTDGTIAYEIAGTGDRIIGTYGGSCCSNYPLGINQQASAGQIGTTAFGGFSKVIGAITKPTEMFKEILVTGWELANQSHNTTPTIIGGIGGGAGSWLNLNVQLISMYFDTVENPANVAGTIGMPTQKVMTLSSISGYCECVNAHVAAPAHGDQLDKIDMYLNSGFFIE